MVQTIRRQGQRGVPRRGGTPRPPPGAAQVPPTENPDFIAWQNQYNPGQGSTAEWYVFRWLENHGYVHGQDFQYLGYAAGIGRVGQQQVDFIINGYLAWAVQGVYFHRVLGDQERDIISRLILEDRGYVVVELLDADILTRLHDTCTKALQGIEQPGARSYRAA